MIADHTFGEKIGVNIYIYIYVRAPLEILFIVKLTTPCPPSLHLKLQHLDRVNDHTSGLSWCQVDAVAGERASEGNVEDDVIWLPELRRDVVLGLVNDAVHEPVESRGRPSECVLV